ncbi:hypothetical protein I3760_08G149400 [Carya illinoinensis]|nr:hypothetical protein I3760_08G149400 [Carya illinoinensis]
MESPCGNSNYLWAEIVASENQQQQQQVEAVYRRRRPQKTPQDVDLNQSSLACRNGNQMSLAAAANKRVYWNGSLSISHKYCCWRLCASPAPSEAGKKKRKTYFTQSSRVHFQYGPT